MDKIKDFLQMISEGIIPDASKLEMTDKKFYDMVDAILYDELIMNERVSRDAQNNIICVFLKDAKLTIRGIKYLDYCGKLETSTHKFEVLCDNKDLEDMCRVGDEYTNFGYEKAGKVEYEGNLILIYAKKKIGN